MNVKPGTFIATIVASLVLIGSACGSSTPITSAGSENDAAVATSAPTESAAATAAPTEAAPTETPTVAPVATPTEAPITQPPGRTDIDPTARLVAFGDAWESSDWATMETLANESAVLAAQEWDGQIADSMLSPDEIARMLANCTLVGDASTECQFVASPHGDGFGLIFTITYTEIDGDLMVTGLLFGGDAG